MLLGEVHEVEVAGERAGDLVGTLNVILKGEGLAELPGTVRIFFQPAEETFNGARHLIDAGALDRVLDRMGAELLRLGVVEGAAIGAADRRARGGDDDG